MSCAVYPQERRMLRDQHLYPPNIAETLAALQRGPESRQPSASRYGLQVRAKHTKGIQGCEKAHHRL